MTSSVISLTLSRYTLRSLSFLFYQRIKSFGWDLGFMRTCNVQELFQLQFNAVQLFVQPIVDPNSLWMLHFNSIHHLLHCSFIERSCWWISILCNKNCPLNKQNLQFKWLGYETSWDVVYGQWIRVETWNWWACQWSVVKIRQLRAVNMDTVHWQLSIW